MTTEADATALGTLLIRGAGGEDPAALGDEMTRAVPNPDSVVDVLSCLSALLSACLIQTCLDQGLDPQQVWSQFALHQATERQR